MKGTIIFLAALSLLAPFVFIGCGSSGDTGPAGASAPTTGTIAGSVTDSVKGDALSGVTVTARKYVNGVGTDNLATTTTDATGSYTLSNLPLGTIAVYFSRNFYTAPGGMVVGVLAGQTISMNAAMSEAASGKPSVAITGYNVANGQYSADDFGYGQTVTLAASGSDANGDNLVYTWSNATSPVLGSVSGSGTSAIVTFPTMAQAFATRADTANSATISGYDLNYINSNGFGNFGVLPILADTRGSVSAKVTVSDGRGQTATVTLGLSAASVQTGVRNVAVGSRVYLNRGDDNTSHTWTLVPPSGSTAALDNNALRFASFVPDIPGKYTLSAASRTIDVYAGNWEGALAATGTLSRNGIAVSDGCTGCHRVGGTAVDAFSSWIDTPHATIFTKGIDAPGAGTSGPGCFACHTVGYDRGVASGGFDDQVGATGWVWPTSLVAGNWAAMVANFPAGARLANIQCESCHGPNADSGAHGNTGSLGSLNKYASARIGFSAEVCGTCHASGAGHNLYSQWNKSAHGGRSHGTRYAPAESNRASCTRCHNAQGWTMYQADLNATPPYYGPITSSRHPEAAQVTQNVAEPITCTVCHDPHSDANPNQLRVYGETPVLLAGFKVVGFGKGALCVTCHSNRSGAKADNVGTFLHEDGATYFDNTFAGPHQSQSDVFAGRNAYFMEGVLPMVSRHAAVEDTCVGCHMALNPATHLSHGTATPNSHSFSLNFTENAANPATMIATFCGNCHGSGTVNGEGIKGNTEAGLEAVAEKLKESLQLTYTNLGGTAIKLGSDNTTADAVTVNSYAGEGNYSLTYTPTGGSQKTASVSLGNMKIAAGGAFIVAPDSVIAKAQWNHDLVEFDRTEGIHNPSFVQLVLSTTRSRLEAFISGL